MADKASKAVAKISPIGGNILVKAAEKEKVTSSGIVLPGSASNEQPQAGEVMALGTGRLNEKGEKVPFNVKVGDKVIFKKYGPDMVELAGQEFLIMEEGDILGVINN